MTCPNPSAHKTRYRFTGVSDDGTTYYWESTRTIDGSRVQQITCNRDWFWHSRTSPLAWIT